MTENRKEEIETLLKKVWKEQNSEKIVILY
jgi:CRISPR/Cas system-associated endonuclease/helicase Cas3